MEFPSSPQSRREPKDSKDRRLLVERGLITQIRILAKNAGEEKNAVLHRESTSNFANSALNRKKRIFQQEGTDFFALVMHTFSKHQLRYFFGHTPIQKDFFWNKRNFSMQPHLHWLVSKKGNYQSTAFSHHNLHNQEKPDHL